MNRVVRFFCSVFFVTMMVPLCPMQSVRTLIRLRSCGGTTARVVQRSFGLCRDVQTQKMFDDLSALQDKMELVQSIRRMSNIMAVGTGAMVGAWSFYASAEYVSWAIGYATCYAHLRWDINDREKEIRSQITQKNAAIDALCEKSGIDWRKTS